MDNQRHLTAWDEDFQQSGGGWWVRLIGIIVYMLIIVAYAWQTLELVSWLFPSENWFMRAVTVFVCDGCATLYAMAEMFYRFRLRKSKHLVFGMWIVTFIFSTCATIVQMYLSSVNLIPHKIDPTVTMIAYGIIIGAFVCNIIAITSVIRMEYNAAQPYRVYLDDRRRKPLPSVRVIEQSPSRAMVPSAKAASPDAIVDPHNMKEQVDSEPKQLAKPSLADRIWAFRDSIDKRIDAPEETSVEQSDELPDNYLDWSDTQWKQAKEQLDEAMYNEIFDEVFPDQKLEPTKSKPAPRAKKKVVKRTRKS